MPCVSSYTIDMFGQPGDLASIQDFLAKGLQKTEGGAWGECVIDLTAIYPDIDVTSEQDFIGVEDDDAFRWSPDLQRLSLRGESKSMPPIFLAERLSRQYAGVRIEIGGTVEEDEIIRWTIQSGTKMLREHGFFLDHDPDDIQWVVKDGVTLPDPPDLVARLQFPTAESSDAPSAAATADMAAFEAELDAFGQ